MEFVTAFNYVPHDGTVFKEPTLTEPQHANSCDINVIFKRATQNGDITPLIPHGSLKYGDVSDVKSFHESLNIVSRNESAFQRLPAAIRAKFGNSISDFLTWLDDPRNVDEAIKLGLKVKVEPKAQPIVSDHAPLVINGPTDSLSSVSSNNSNNGDVKDV